MKGKYLYGIVDKEEEIRFSSRGLFNKRPYLIKHDGISAIVTDAPLETYEADQEKLLAHNRVLEEVIKLCAVLPMRFGTIARSEDEVRGLVRNAHSVFRERIKKIKDKVEFDLEIHMADEAPLLKEIVENNSGIRELRDKLISRGKDAGIEDKFKIGRMIAEEVAKYKSALLKAVDESFKPYYSERRSLPKKQALTNTAYLVMRQMVEKFESGIYKLGERFGDRVKFKYAGPLAPYSFVGMKLLLINFETVDAARRQLGLGEQAGLSDIKEAYRKLANKYHPDKSPDDNSKEEEFKKIASAYSLLREYCRHYPKKMYVFKSDEIDEVSVVAGIES